MSETVWAPEIAEDGGTKFPAGKLFAWRSTMYRADTDCICWAAVIEGEMTGMVDFDLECDEEMAVAMLEAAGASTEFLMIGSDSGEDEGAPEDDEDDE